MKITADLSPTQHLTPSRLFRLAAGAVGLAALLGAAACNSTSRAGTPDSDSNDANPNGEPPPVFAAWQVPPERIDTAIEALPDIVNRAMGDTGIPGMAVAVVHNGNIVFAEGFGTTDLNTGAPVNADTAFQLASLSKSISASVISAKVTKGTIAWDDPIVEHLPGFQLADPYVTAHVSYADMYSHRSGLPGHIGDTLEDLGYDRDYILDHLQYAPITEFRAKNEYTNFGITAAAQAVANASGMSWDDLSRTVLYKPLGMTRTTSSYQEFLTQHNRALLHVPTENGWQTRHTRDADAQSPAGGVSSTANDFATWMNFILAGGKHDGDQLINSATLATMLSPHSSKQPPGSLDSRAGTDNLGFNGSVNSTARQTFNHSGAFNMGTGTTYTLVPAENLGIVVLTNGFPLGAAEAIAAEFLDLALVGANTQPWLKMYREAFKNVTAIPGAITEPAPLNPVPAKALSSYTGQWSNNFVGRANVTVKGDALVLEIGPNGETYPVTHWDGDKFFWTAPGENGGEPTFITFDLVADTMTIASLNQTPPLGVFTR
ncbi:Beta-lactamase [Halioglobus japonicus]|nr:Beta-lactamase [Halioglobus japonicus]